eukprot:8546215-Ditylum_brightwellii.AAC.1
MSYRVKFSQSQAVILQSPVNDSQLIHDSGIITEKDLAQHLVETNSWTSEVFSWIDWSIFQRCRNSLDQRDNPIVKLTYNILPTNLLLHKYDELVSGKCMFYKASPETRDHL